MVATEVTSQGPLPGTRWVRRNGKHGGTEIEIDHVSDNSVFFKTVGGGENWGNQKTDDSKVNRLLLTTFSAHYVRKQDLAAGDAHGGGRAFRRVHVKKLTHIDGVPEETLKPVSKPSPLQMNGYIMTGDSPLTIEVVQITPELAKDWLSRGGQNRKLVPRRVARLSAAIRAGEWVLTGDSIKIAEDGTILDGQHRLNAIVDAGLTVTTLVVRNVPAPAMDVIDTGKSRTAGDVLAIHGHVSVNAKASAARGMILIERFGRFRPPTTRDGRDYVTNATILSYVDKHPDLNEAVRMADLMRAAGMAGGSGLIAVFCTLILRVDAEKAREFIRSLISGAELQEDSPILRLRNRLMNQQRFYGSGNEREAYLAIAIKAWNAWRLGEKMQLLIWRESEGFPKPV